MRSEVEYEKKVEVEDEKKKVKREGLSGSLSKATHGGVHAG